MENWDIFYNHYWIKRQAATVMNFEKFSVSLTISFVLIYWFYWFIDFIDYWIKQFYFYISIYYTIITVVLLRNIAKAF